ncbi:MAG TPA: hypothetical protein VK549_16300 [Acidimicrobiia bacterium]|nr:hypothetical protein [Acidimicrobiia bacterium]
MTKALHRRRNAAVAGVAAAAIVAAYLRCIEPWFRRWGATDEEVQGPLPVDDLVEPGVTTTTRAITVRAPLQDVWPWLVQIGQDRAGFYSYTWLENFVGARMHNAYEVHPEWQERFAGDSVWLASERRFHDRGRQVAAMVKVMRALVLVSPEDWNRLQRGERARGAWGFFLEPLDDTTTRFVIRSSGGPVGTHLFDAIHFVMEHKMMRGLRRRAER